MRLNIVIKWILILAFNSLNVKAQVVYYQFIAELDLSFSKQEERKLESAVKSLEAAELLFERADGLYNELSDIDKEERISESYSIALKTLFEASDFFNKAYSEATSVFHAQAEAFRKSMSKTNQRASGMDKARYYENLSIKNLNRSNIRFEQVKESDRYEYSLNILNDAIELGRLSIRNSGRAAQIYDDYPVEYNYGWEDDKTLLEIVALMKDPNLNDPPTDIFGTLNSDAATEDTIVLKEIIFKVQIAAHTDALSEEYLAKIYKGDIKIDLINEEGWYKYSIGRYLNFDEADATLRECKIDKAFIVAYQEGKKIGTKEALTILDGRYQVSND